MNITQIEINLQKLIATFNKENFIYQLLLAYGLPKASITRLQKGNLNLAKEAGEIAWKKKLFFKAEHKEDLHLAISRIAKNLKHNERFVMLTDYKTILAIDTKTDDKLDIALTDLPKHYDFFLPWVGMEKAQHANENPADVKAAEKMAKLFDVIKKDNPNDSPEFVHGLNVFLSRLLFCFFAEDTHIFEENQFTNAIDSHTQQDGSDLNTFLERIFKILNTPETEPKSLSEGHTERSRSMPEYLNAFPYVNGGLFEKEYKTPKFSRTSRIAILNSGDQDWSAINPDIFGSMFQAVISVDQRGSLGQHYTSVPNIMKVIEPLFLNDLYEELEKAGDNTKKLNALLNRIHNLKIFDPACGSGNFLIIAYKELRILEMKIFKAGNMMALSGIQLSQFYGIEIDDFAGEIAKLALWLAEHQMNVAFFNEFGRTNPTLPLKEAGKIVQGNATRLDWEVVCPKTKDSEIYILGNPPYLGSNYQNNIQKEDLQICFNHSKGIKNLDYISNWFILSAKFIQNTIHQASFVSTNSICQGEQVSMLWPKILDKGISIKFAYNSFKWKNQAKNNAGVTVIIIGLANKGQITKKLLFKENKVSIVKNISPYLLETSNLIVNKRLKPISSLPIMSFGSKLVDGGNFIFSVEEYDKLVNSYPNSKVLFRKLIGADEFIKGYNRWCLWIKDETYKKGIDIPEILNRIENVKQFRLNSKKKATVKSAETPYKFGEIRYFERPSIIVPRVTSERREYLTCGYLEGDCVILDRAQAIFDADTFVLGILSSKIHVVWTSTFAGRLETRLNYSSTLVYNTFPFPPISTQRKNEITQAVFRILEEREKHSDKTLAQLYDPNKMPEGLREAHRQNDIIIEKCYRSTTFKSDEERLEYLFKLYEKMIAEEKNAGTLFAKEKPKRKKRK